MIDVLFTIVVHTCICMHALVYLEFDCGKYVCILCVCFVLSFKNYIVDIIVFTSMVTIRLYILVVQFVLCSS